MSRRDFDDFVVQWRKRLSLELRTNRSGHLPRRCEQVADSVPRTFPSYATLSLYASPLVSPMVEDIWQPRPPNVQKILDLCDRYFDHRCLGTLFRKHLIPGLFFKSIQLQV